MWVRRHSRQAHSTSGGDCWAGRGTNLSAWGEQVVPVSTTMPHLLVEPLPIPLPEAVASETSESSTIWKTLDGDDPFDDGDHADRLTGRCQVVIGVKR